MKPCVLALSILALAAPAMAAETTAPQPAPSTCPGTAPIQTRDQAGRPQGQYKRLDQLPQAQAMLTVMKSVGGCQVAVVKVGDRHFDVPQGGERRVRREDVTPRMR